MASIVFLPLPGMGHLVPTLKLAKRLKSRGHRVSYLGVPDFASTVRLEQLEFVPIFERQCPPGFLHEHAVKRRIANIDAISAEAARGDQGVNLLGELDRVVGAIEPDLFVIDNLFADVALMIAEKGIPFVLVNTQLFNFWELNPAYKELMSVPELILSSPEFDFPREDRRKRTYYIGASIDMARQEVSFPWAPDDDKELVYCALGTMSHMVGAEKEFLQSVIDAMHFNPRRQLVLSMGAHLSRDSFRDIAPNVILVNKAPQLAMLRRASMMITHGGFNTVKECITFGVPMLLFPTLGDTAQVAARVVYLGLGIRGNLRRVRAREIHEMMEWIDQNPSVRRRIAAMRERFLEMEESAIGVDLIESLLATASTGQGDPRF